MRLIRTKFRVRRVGVPLLLALLGLAVAAPPATAQDFTKYHTYAELTGAIRALAGSFKNTLRVESIGKTLGGRDIWVMEIANPGGTPPANRPALLVAANFEADHLIGSEIALFIAADLLKKYPADADVKQRLDNTVIYVIPRVNPDGAEGMFGPVKTGLKTNANPRDDDNDGRLDEDGPEDLNKDGFITVMRLKAADGEYMADPSDTRLLRKADPKKGEAGLYKIFWEGIDNDNDGFINEDPPGGTDLNRNFMHEYPYYSPDAGPHMISERETRALMDWLIAHRNIAAVLTFGESDNLIVPTTNAGRLGPQRELDLVRFADASISGARTFGMIQTGGGFGFGRRGMGMFTMEMLREFTRQRTPAPAGGTSGRFRMPDRKPATTVNTSDVDYFRAVAEKYGEITGLRQPVYVREPQGAFFQYAYYQFGVPSFSTPGFGQTGGEGPGQRRMPGQAPGGQPSGQESRAGAGDMATMTGGGGQQSMMMRQGAGAGMMPGGQPGQGAQGLTPGVDGQVLKWMDGEKIDGFVAWTKVTHPDLGEVEIGGFKPYAAVNPPAANIAGLGASHAKFVLYLSSLFPRVRIATTSAVSHGGGLFRIKAEVENSGFLPTSLAHGVTARSVKPTMVRLGVKPGDIISGNNKTEFFQALDGSGNRVKYEWLILGKAGQTVELTVASEKGGTDKARITLK